MFVKYAQILDLFSAISILLDEVYQVNYYLYREINKCLTLIDGFLEVCNVKQTQRCQSKNINSLYKKCEE